MCTDSYICCVVPLSWLFVASNSFCGSSINLWVYLHPKYRLAWSSKFSARLAHEQCCWINENQYLSANSSSRLHSQSLEANYPTNAVRTYQLGWTSFRWTQLSLYRLTSQIFSSQRPTFPGHAAQLQLLIRPCRSDVSAWSNLAPLGYIMWASWRGSCVEYCYPAAVTCHCFMLLITS